MDSLDIRTRRFVAAVVEAEDRGRVNLASEGLAGARWDLRQLEAHPIGGEPIAVASGPGDSEDASRRTAGFTPSGWFGLVLTAVRTDGAAEVSVGIVFHHRIRHDGRIADGGSPVFIPANVAPAYRGTAIVRCAWHVAGDAPDVVASFRGRPVPGRQDEHLLHLWVELPSGWDEGVSERPESVLSGRSEAFGESDRLALGVPWLHEDRELALSFPLADLHTAVAELTALVTP